MINIANISFLVVGAACVIFGVLFIARRKARIFYGVNVEGRKAVVSGSVLVVVGLAALIFGIFIFPDLVDLGGILDDIPEYGN